MPYVTWKSFDWKYDSLPLFEAIRDKENAFFLDSSLRKNGLGRYSFLGFEPFYVLRANGDENLFGKIRELLRRYTLDTKGYAFPFLNGAVGYFSYDLGLNLEKIEAKEKRDALFPKVWLGFYDTVIALDHLKKKLIVASSGFPERTHYLAQKKATQKLTQCIKLLSVIEPFSGKKENIKAKEPCHRSLISNFTKPQYLKAIAKAKAYIRKGDIYQVNLSQRFSARTDMDSFDLYVRLRKVSPSSFSSYLDCGDFQIISSSPERFLCYDGKKAVTRPMKGTRPRGNTKEEDACQKKELLKSAKDKAELVMIVDLMRNDLGRVCEYTSVKVTSLRALEAYSTVYQATATIEGKLHKDKDRVDLLKACFPGGSITGCPKIRSMQIIDELEPTRRGMYTGSLGYLSFHNTMDLNILIRTMVKKDDTMYFQVGGGIVADSVPEAEYEETLVKAQGILRAIESRF